MMPSEKEIKKLEKNYRGYVRGDGKTAHDFAKAYLSVKEWPERLIENDDSHDFEECSYQEGYNDAIEICRMAHLKQTEELREALKELLEACLTYIPADANEKLSNYVDGSLLDRATDALEGERK